MYLNEQFIRKGKKYMNSEDVKEWLQIADEDLYSAKILNEAARKPVIFVYLVVTSQVKTNRRCV